MNDLCRGVAVLLFLSIAVVTVLAQSIPSSARECAPEDLDATFQFANIPRNEQVVAINFRNMSDKACTLRGGDGVSFSGAHGHAIYAKDCRNCSPKGEIAPVTHLTLAPEETAHFLLSWQTSLVDSRSPCQESDGFYVWVNNDTHPIGIVAPCLVARICSVVKADSYLPGSFGGKGQSLDVPYSEEAQGATIMASSADTLYAGDSFSFGVTIEDSNGVLPRDDRSCPTMFIETRTPEGETHFQEINSFAVCTFTRHDRGPGGVITIEIRPSSEQGMLLGVLLIPGARWVRFHALISSPHAPKVEMITSNTLDLTVVDPATLPRNWGDVISGLAVSLLLDKEEYLVGEEIPLRIGVENFSAEKSIQREDHDPGITIEVRDSAGRLIDNPGGARGPAFSHGRRVGYPKGKVVPVLRMTLRRLEPGSYTAVAIWKAYSVALGLTIGSLVLPDGPLVPYAVVRSKPVRFQVQKSKR